LPEMKIQRFGSKCEDCDDAKSVAKSGDKDASSFDFFQMGSQQLPEVTTVRQVGEVVADHPAAALDNATASGESAQVGIVAAATPMLSEEPAQVGFVAAAQPPPALSVLPPLPFLPDDVTGAHIHVAASIATQELSDSSKQDTEVGIVASPVSVMPSVSASQVGVAISEQKLKAAPEEQDEAWSNFTAAEALHSRNRDAGSLGTDAATEPVPVSAEVSKETVASASNGVVHPQVVDERMPPLSKLALQATTAKPAVFETSDAGFMARHSMLFFWMLAIAFALLIGGVCFACLGAGFLASFVWQRRLVTGKTSTRSQVEDLQVCCAKEVSRRVPSSGGYDCTFSKPISSCMLLRLEARVEGPAAGGVALTAPLTGQACVLYSVAVSRQLHDGIHPAPVAFASGSMDFVISLTDSPSTRINLHAEEVSLFDMKQGRHTQRKSFAAAPDKWQDFILTHRAGTEWQTSSQMRLDSSPLEFQECALHCGTLATFVGELSRGADGTLSLRPLQVDSLDVQPQCRSSGLSERWRTSWECGVEANNIASEPQLPSQPSKLESFDKVMASDDRRLFEGSSSLCSISSSLCRLPGKFGGGRSLIGMCRGGKRAEKGPGVLETHSL